MLNVLWAGMILLGICFGCISGNMNAVTGNLLVSAREAVTLAFSMLGIMAFWSGILEIAEQSGMITALVQAMNPLLRFLFPHLPKNHPVQKDIAVNMIANIMGMGWAATPAGLKAMEGLLEVSTMANGVASNEMCTFLIINVSSLQLIPINMIAYRSQYLSKNPAAILGPALIATSISTISGILYCRLKDR